MASEAKSPSEDLRLTLWPWSSNELCPAQSQALGSTPWPKPCQQYTFTQESPAPHMSCSTMAELGMELRLSGVAARTVTHWATLPERLQTCPSSPDCILSVTASEKVNFQRGCGFTVHGPRDFSSRSGFGALVRGQRQAWGAHGGAYCSHRIPANRATHVKYQ